MQNKNPLLTKSTFRYIYICWLKQIILTIEDIGNDPKLYSKHKPLLILLYTPAREASGEVANLTERKNFT